MTTMTYKSYEAIVAFDEDADIFHGEVINLCRFLRRNHPATATFRGYSRNCA